MASAPSIYRIILAVGACLGFCGLNCLHLGAAPVETPKDLVIYESVYEESPVFAVSHDFSSQGVIRPNRAELPSFVFGVDAPLAVLLPVFTLERLLDESLPEGQSVESRGMRNKDPPSLMAGILVFHLSS
jgi:hypothetical protein